MCKKDNHNHNYLVPPQRTVQHDTHQVFLSKGSDVSNSMHALAICDVLLSAK